MRRGLLLAPALLLTGCPLFSGSSENPAASASPSASPVPSAPGSASAPGSPSASASVTGSGSGSPSASGSPSVSPAASASPSAPGCGPGMSRISKYCVDSYEAHLVVVHEDGHEEPWPHTQRPPADKRYEARSARGMFPQGYISRNEATKACKNAGKRLCSMDEWRRACQGKRGYLYGYGMKRKTGACSSGKDHLLSKLYGTSGKGWKYDEHFNNPELNQLPGFLDRSGEHGDCTAGEGVYDMVGNLHEWVSDTLDDALIERIEKEDVERRKQPRREGNGLFLGGFFSTTSELGPGCKYLTMAHEPGYHDYSTGFRCCMTAAK